MRKRNYRDEKESKAQADIRRAKDNEAKKNKLKSETLEQKNARKTTRNEKLKEKRRAKKLALAEFQRIQTVPRTLTSQPQVSDRLSQKGGIPRCNDGNASSGSDLNDSISEYEKIRLRNIEERNALFKSLFHFENPPGPSHSHYTTTTAKKKVTEPDSATSDEEFEVNFGTIPKRKLPKRSCTIQKLSQQKCPNLSNEDEDSNDDSDASLDGCINTLVEMATALENVDNHFTTDNFANELNSILNRPVFKPLQNCYLIKKEDVMFDNLASLTDDFDMPPLSYPAHLEYLYDELSEYYQKHKKSVLGRKTKDAKRKAEERKVESGYAYDLRMAENSERY